MEKKNLTHSDNLIDGQPFHLERKFMQTWFFFCNAKALRTNQNKLEEKSSPVFNHVKNQDLDGDISVPTSPVELYLTLTSVRTTVGWLTVIMSFTTQTLCVQAIDASFYGHAWIYKKSPKLRSVETVDSLCFMFPNVCPSFGIC